MLDFTAGPHASCYIDVNHERAPYKGGPDSSVCKVDQRSASERRVRLGILYIPYVNHIAIISICIIWILQDSRMPGK